MAIVTMRYWAAAKEAAGVAEETVMADTLAAALAAVRSRRASKALAGLDGAACPRPAGAAHDSQLSAVLARSSFLINGHPVGKRAAEGVLLADGAVIEVLPPFAGG